MKTQREKAEDRDNPPPSLGSPTDPGYTKTEKKEGEVMNKVKAEMSSSKVVGKKRRNLQTKKILKKLRKVADMRAETIRLRKEIDKMEAAAKEKKKVLKLEKKKRNRCLTENLLMSVTEHHLMEILFPPSGNY